MKRKFFRVSTLLLLAGMLSFSFVATSCGDDDDDPVEQVQEFTITYDANGGSGTVAPTKFKPGAKITLADASWFCGVTYDDRVKLRKEILDTTNDDLRTAAAALRKAFAEAQSCVVASAEALEQCGITEIKSIA